jgi:hypothetical protein
MGEIIPSSKFQIPSKKENLSGLLDTDRLGFTMNPTFPTSYITILYIGCVRGLEALV